MIGYKSEVKELYFIRQGIVEIFNNENDEKKEKKDQAIMYLPKFSYFGDYQILYNLKSNIVFKTLSKSQFALMGQTNVLPESIFMCISKDILLKLCDLFP